ncbi:hypothetical protein FRC10_002431 [Ceratobasidium sp. 414]|nr:hypothetical protein FRC10_002431 [Ceratobasidium sp. 414]
MFDALKVWFVPVEGTENEYVVEKQRYIVSPEVPQHFRFSLVSSNPDLAVPNRQYLAIRAACARVLHMSGAARVIDRILDEREDVKVLAKDGSSAELLEYLLFGAEIMAH